MGQGPLPSQFEDHRLSSIDLHVLPMEPVSPCAGLSNLRQGLQVVEGAGQIDLSEGGTTPRSCSQYTWAIRSE